MHNGTVTKSRFDNHTKYDTDSEALFAHMNTHGVEDTWRITEGAASLVWYNKQDNTVNFLRNDERPMWLYWSKSGRQLYFASEPWMIIGICLRNKEVLDDEGPFKTKINRVYQLNVDTLGVVERDLKPAPKPTYTAYNGYKGGWKNDYSSGQVKK